MFRLSGTRLVRASVAAIAMLTLVGMSAYAKGSPPPSGSTVTVIHSFTGASADGQGPQAGLVSDGSGNFYGATSSGGANNLGSVFRITPAGAESIIYSFGANQDGSGPGFGDLIIDPSGNLYGTTTHGGTNNAGTVFEVTPSGTEAFLYSFGGTSVGGPAGQQADGSAPYARLARDSSGNIYGTTTKGGTTGNGVVFELSPSGAGYNYSVLYNFAGGTGDGSSPRGLTLGPDGNLYGVTSSGGPNGAGTVFELSSPSQGVWQETPLHSFAGGTTDGSQPYGTLIFDSSGNIYGTTVTGGAYFLAGNYGKSQIDYGGTVFELAKNGSSWNYSTLWSFGNPRLNPKDGIEVYAGLLLYQGNLYGTTAFGSNVPGTVFKLTKSGSTWTETVLHTFTNNPDGAAPYSDLIVGSDGNLYGTTTLGGTSGKGTVFKITP